MLSAGEIAKFRRNGYLIVENVLGPGVLDPVRAEYQAIMDTLLEEWQLTQQFGGLDFAEQIKATYALGLDWFQPMDISLPGDRIRTDTPMHFGPAVFDMVTAPRLLDLVEALIGPEITSCPIQHVRIKPPARDLARDELRAHVGGTDWHQDRAVAHVEADQTDMVTVWIAVTDATPENGCLQVLPRAADRMLTHCPMRQTTIAPGLIDPEQALPVPVRADGIVVLDPLIPHASLPNLTDGIRWSFDLRYARSGQPTGRSHFPAFVARSRSEPHTELRDWRRWRQMWVDARARLATEPHIQIHRWQGDSPLCA
ncbi:phytanoyl-CoA dioxygenase family protein [Ruegeria sp. WL0004]|uniref:Phytanoyl-CoA dioxygenase family protein n=1 Tax=Ruegeria marisflavi TaxID=2984152 RepID=A0ABT2WYW6_9RHOB|nr:phytanoyl-CoA dioxygenase family protein [Ruegeria sp. WL0004]MCU9840190.1 phytanoyl-CoA dioxygenase family protein [Ruegeria sp. WL0004]